MTRWPMFPLPRGAEFLTWCTHVHCPGRDALHTIWSLGRRDLLHWGKFFLNSARHHEIQPNKYWSDQYWSEPNKYWSAGPRGVMLYVLVSQVEKGKWSQGGRKGGECLCFADPFRFLRYCVYVWSQQTENHCPLSIGEFLIPFPHLTTINPCSCLKSPLYYLSNPVLA